MANPSETGVDGVARGLRLLSLDGGGIRGLSELLILERIMVKLKTKNNLQHVPIPADVFDMIGGTRTGGLIALLLGRLRLSATEALEVYVELAGDVFSTRSSILSGFAFDATKLERAIRKVVKEHLGDDNKKMVEEVKQNGVERQVCKAPEIGVKMCLGTPEFELSDFLESPTSTYYLPTNQAGPDLVGLFSPSRRTNLRYVVFLQAKLTRELDSKDVNKAIGTTNPSKFFIVRSTGDILEGYQDHYSRVQKALENFDRFFRVVVAFPLNIQSKGGKPMKTVPFVKIDATNASLLFEDSLQKFLRLLVEK